MRAADGDGASLASTIARMPQPPLDIDSIHSVKQLEQHASRLEESVRLQTAHIHRTRERIAHLKAVKRASRKRCTTEGCTNFAARGGICVRHGAVPTRCSHEGCPKKSQNSGVCARHGARMKACSVEGCRRLSKNKTGLCARHGTDRCSHEGCGNLIVLRGMCNRHADGTTRKETPKISCRTTGEFCVSRGGSDTGPICVRDGGAKQAHSSFVQGEGKGNGDGSVV